MAWDPQIWTLAFISCSGQHMIFTARNVGGLTLMGTVVYGSNFQQEKTSLWNDLRRLARSNASMPWIVMGDFNTVRFTDEKLGGKLLSINQLKEFNDCLDYCSLTDMKSTGNYWSWHNKS